ASATAKRDPVVQRLYEKAKQLGTWDPAAIDLSLDAEHWRGLTGDERDFLFRIASLFFTAEEAVTRDLLPAAFVTANERRLDDELAGDMHRLLVDASPPAQARAFTTYCLLLEGVLADTGQRVLEDALGVRGILPGLQEALVLVNRDESRHVAYGLHVLRRLIAADTRVAEVVHARIEELT